MICQTSASRPAYCHSSLHAVGNQSIIIGLGTKAGLNFGGGINLDHVICDVTWYISNLTTCTYIKTKKLAILEF